MRLGKTYLLVMLLMMPHMNARAWWVFGQPVRNVLRTAGVIGATAIAGPVGFVAGAAVATATAWPHWRRRYWGHRHAGYYHGDNCSGGSGGSFGRSRPTARGGRLDVSHNNGWTTRTRTGPFGFRRTGTRYTGIGAGMGERDCAHPDMAYHGNRGYGKAYGRGYDSGRGGSGGSVNVGPVSVQW